MAQKMIPQIPKSPYRHFCDEMWAAWWTEITRDSSWLTESLIIIRFFKIISNICYYLNINVLSLFQWAITKVNSNISSNVKSSTEDRCTYICMYRECHALAHWLLSIKARNGGFVACSFQTLQITLNLKQGQRLFFFLNEGWRIKNKNISVKRNTFLKPYWGFSFIIARSSKSIDTCERLWRRNTAKKIPF